MRVPIFSTSISILLTVQISDYAFLVGIKLHLIVILIHISLRANDAGYIFLFLLVICTYSLEKCLLRSFPIFKLGYLFIVAL